MRSLFKDLLFLIALSLVFGVSPVAPEIHAESGGGKFIAYYFHTTARCATCLKIEKQAEEVIKTDFATQLESGQLEWKVVDVQFAENQHFVQDFQLLTKSLVLVEQVEGKPRRFKTLDKTWELVRYPEQYRDYVKQELNAFLKAH